MKRIIHKGKWLSFGEVDLTTQSGNKRTWEFITREGTTGSVCILAIHSDPPASIVLVKHFRPPLQAEILEFPAGLIESGHSKEATALKELREETGCIGTVLSQGPGVFNSPGMSDENTACVIVKVTERHEQATEDDEDIEVVELELKDLKQQLITLEAGGLRIDAKLWSFAEGLALQSLLNGSD
jgi:8-oxo-dGTP pyrophosphatase MutT (NUDIX family)